MKEVGVYSRSFVSFVDDKKQDQRLQGSGTRDWVANNASPVPHPLVLSPQTKALAIAFGTEATARKSGATARNAKATARRPGATARSAKATARRPGATARAVSWSNKRGR